MRIGVPSEIKVHEYRVGLMPAAVRELVSDGHQLAVQSGAGNGVGCSDEDYRAAGVLLGGVAGIPPARVVVIGGGVAGTHAVEMAHGLRADVTVIDRSLPRLRALDVQFHGVVQTLFSTLETIERCVADADLVIGAVLVPGAAAPKLVSEAMIKQMRPGSVVVDIAIDHGGCFPTSRPP